MVYRSHTPPNDFGSGAIQKADDLIEELEIAKDYIQNVEKEFPEF